MYELPKSKTTNPKLPKDGFPEKTSHEKNPEIGTHPTNFSWDTIELSPHNSSPKNFQEKKAFFEKFQNGKNDNQKLVSPHKRISSKDMTDNMKEKKALFERFQNEGAVEISDSGKNKLEVSNEPSNSVTRFLNKYKKIRIFIPVAPGSGHQSASVALMYRLRTLGYRGTFQVIYQEGYSGPTKSEEKINRDNSVKLENLLPGFDPKKPKNQIQQLENNIEVASIEYLNQIEDEIEIGMTGAIDDKHEELQSFAKEIPSKLKIKTFLQLQPLQWNSDDGRRGIRSKSGEIEPIDYLEESKLGYIYGDLKPQDTTNKDFLDSQLRLYPNYKNAIETVKKILDEPNGKRTVDSLAVYGATTGVTEAKTISQLAFLLKGVMSAQETLKKAVVIPIIGRLVDTSIKESIEQRDNYIFDELTKNVDKMQVGKDKDEDEKKILENRVTLLNVDSASPEEIKTTFMQLKEHSILIIRFPSQLPKETFDLLFSKTTLPNAMEGLNTLDKALQTKGSYIRIAKTAGKEYPKPPFDKEDEREFMKNQAKRSQKVNLLFSKYGENSILEAVEAYQKKDFGYEYFNFLYFNKIPIKIPDSLEVAYEKYVINPLSRYKITGVPSTTTSKTKSPSTTTSKTNFLSTTTSKPESPSTTINKPENNPKFKVKIKLKTKENPDAPLIDASLIDAPFSSEKALQELHKANSPWDILGEFIVDSITAGTDLNKYFQALKNYYTQNDQVELGVAELEKFYQKKELNKK
jgi:hypothetical protein